MGFFDEFINKSVTPEELENIKNAEARREMEAEDTFNRFNSFIETGDMELVAPVLVMIRALVSFEPFEQGFVIGKLTATITARGYCPTCFKKADAGVDAHNGC